MQNDNSGMLSDHLVREKSQQNRHERHDDAQCRVLPQGLWLVSRRAPRQAIGASSPPSPAASSRVSSSFNHGGGVDSAANRVRCLFDHKLQVLNELLASDSMR